MQTEVSVQVFEPARLPDLRRVLDQAGIPVEQVADDTLRLALPTPPPRNKDERDAAFAELKFALHAFLPDLEFDLLLEAREAGDRVEGK